MAGFELSDQSTKPRKLGDLLCTDRVLVFRIP